MRDRILAVVLAGGKGSRLEPLTRDRAKPAVPFGGSYRIIDFTLSNCLNSKIRKMLLLTQYKAISLNRHIDMGWNRYFCREMGEFVDVVPPQQWIDENWYQGTADAVYQNIYSIEKEQPDHVVILAGDHIYKMDYSRMIDAHRDGNADLTIGVLPVPVDRARGQFGVMETDGDLRVVGFEEKPQNPKPLPGNDNVCMASMGIYVFRAHFLFDELCHDANRCDSRHDFGCNIIPSIIDKNRVFAFPFMDENRKTQAYWRDVGTVDAYYDANMDLVGVDPLLNLYDEEWPIYTFHPNLPPAKFVFDEGGRTGHAIDSIVCPGTILSGGEVKRSIIGNRVRINSYATVEDSIIFSRVNIGRNVKIHRAIIDKGVVIPPDMEVGFDHELDRARGFTVTENGVTVIAKNEQRHFVNSEQLELLNYMP